ncbi:hypothetical protein [Kitasatospora sp. NPDC050543]|uniref:hypothetical protein n=1 Tax=Kitasatospora sp. NPDC050543 TaxID=3364054 RepID=UPI003790F61B
MTTQGERNPPPVGRPSRGPAEAHHAQRGGPRRALVWCAVIAVVAGGGWIVTRPHPGDWIPGLGPSSKDAAKTPPVVGNPQPSTVADPDGLTAERYFPAQRGIELGAYKAKRSGARQGQDCAETLQDRTVENPLAESGCRGYITVSFSELDRPVQSSVTVLQFTDEFSAEKAARTLQDKPALLAFILPDASPAPAPTAGAKTPATSVKVAAVRRYVTFTSSRFADAHGATGVPGAVEQQLDEATRALSFTVGQPFIWT